MTSILITGANGFVGRALCKSLNHEEYQVKAAIRSASAQSVLDENVVPVVVGEINAATDWQVALAGVDVVIHLAARAHVMRETVQDPLQAFRLANTIGTENLARQAAAAGVKRFVFLSTIKVLGEKTLVEAFTKDTPVITPKDAYALSKWEAEQVLQEISAISGMQVVVIRPPLVYGAGVKGNLLRLMQLIKRGWPLPFAAIGNKRSLVYIENLCDLLRICILHPAAAGQVLLCADGEDFSTPELVRQLANVLDVPPRLYPIPVGVLKKLALWIKKSAEIARLCDSLQVDARQTQQLLKWQPPFTAKQGIAKTAASFLAVLE